MNGCGHSAICPVDLGVRINNKESTLPTSLGAWELSGASKLRKRNRLEPYAVIGSYSPEKRFRYESASSPRFSRWPLKPGFGQVNIALDPAQGLVVDSFFVAQLDHGVAFCL